jgi:beta-xylosidase
LDGATAVNPAVGVQFHALWSDYTDQERVVVLDKLAAAGVTWVRIDLGWQSLQEVGREAYSQWYIDRADRTIDMARDRGISVLATLWATPDWANGGAGRHVPPTDLADYARVARWAAEHFNGRVGAWEVWNEPNHPSFWSGTAADYTELLKAAYPAFKAGAPSTPVVLGAPCYNDTDWLQEMYAAGGQGSFDIMATHPYQGVSNTPPEAPDDGTVWRLSHVAAVHALMDRYGDGDKKIWFTEFGWSSHENTGTEKSWAIGVSEQQQADFLVRTIEHLAANFPYVTNIFWYAERNRVSGKVHLDNYGLLRRDLSEKPAYTALREFLTGPALPETDLPLDEPLAPLLTNGGFESGLAGWTAFHGAASTTSDARTGASAAKMIRKRDAYGLASGALAAPATSWVRADGFLRTKRSGQTIRLVVSEVANGVVVDREVVRTTVGTRWEAFPPLEYTLSGSPGAALVIKVKSSGRKGDVFFLDDVTLTAGG